jgi:hypothetical protein
MNWELEITLDGPHFAFYTVNTLQNVQNFNI